MPEKLLTIKQVQELLGVSERTLFNFMARGDLRGFKVGRSWRFEESDVQDYIRKQRDRAAREREKNSA